MPSASSGHYRSYARCADTGIFRKNVDTWVGVKVKVRSRVSVGAVLGRIINAYVQILMMLIGVQTGVELTDEDTGKYRALHKTHSDVLWDRNHKTDSKSHKC